MYSFEKEIAKREMLHPVVSYPYQVVPISEQAKLHFGLTVKKSGPIEKLVNLFKKGEELTEFPFVGQRTFFYDDPKESEQDRIQAVKQLAQFNMARHGVRGISYKDPHWDLKSFNATLREGEDYKIQVGEKIVHEQPKTLTWDDVEAL